MYRSDITKLGRIIIIQRNRTAEKMHLFMTFVLLVALVSARSPENEELQLLDKRSTDEDRFQLLEGQYAELSAQLNDGVSQLTNEVQTLNDKSRKAEFLLQLIVGNIQNEQLQKISFTAKAVSTGTFSAGAAIVFDTVIEESGGNNYSTTTGKFTCPVSGVYAFSATLINLSGNNKYYAHFMLDDVIQTKLYGKVISAGEYETTAGTITIRCNEGQTVYIQTPSDEKLSVNGYSFFSGFYLFLPSA